MGSPLILCVILCHRLVETDETSPPFPLSARGEGAMSDYG